MERRTFCKAAIAAASCGSVLGTASGATTAETAHDGYVSTRDHFNPGWFFPPSPVDGISPTEYETTTVPGYDDTASPETIVVYIHGWNNTASAAQAGFDTFANAMAHYGYTGPIVGYSWDAKTGWHEAAWIAKQNGRKLAAFLMEYRDRNPETKINIVAHSQGPQVALSALEALDEWGFSGRINRLSLLGAAVPRREVSLNGDYGSLLETLTWRTNSFYKTDDSVLNWAFSGAELERALGSYGIYGPAPSTYAEYDVTDDVEHHSAHNTIDGCVDQLLDTW